MLEMISQVKGYKTEMIEHNKCSLPMVKSGLWTAFDRIYVGPRE